MPFFSPLNTFSSFSPSADIIRRLKAQVSLFFGGTTGSSHFSRNLPTLPPTFFLHLDDKRILLPFLFFLGKKGGKGRWAKVPFLLPPRWRRPPPRPYLKRRNKSKLFSNIYLWCLTRMAKYFHKYLFNDLNNQMVCSEANYRPENNKNNNRNSSTLPHPSFPF